MALVTWDQSYSVKVKRCDADHQKLFSLINALHDAMRTCQGSKVIADTVHELETYTKTHFSAEEALLQRAGYPKLAEHHAEHQVFIAKVKEFKDCVARAGAEAPISVLTFLKDWLSNHILQTDKLYSEHLNSHGIE